MAVDPSVTAQAKPFTSTLPRKQDKTLLSHLVNCNGYPDGTKLTPDEDGVRRGRLPADCRVDEVLLASRDEPVSRKLADWEVRRCRLKLTVEELW